MRPSILGRAARISDRRESAAYIGSGGDGKSFFGFFAETALEAVDVEDFGCFAVLWGFADGAFINRSSFFAALIRSDEATMLSSFSILEDRSYKIIIGAK